MQRILNEHLFVFLFGAGLFYLALQTTGILLFIGLIMVIPAIKSISHKRRIKMGYKVIL